MSFKLSIFKNVNRTNADEDIDMEESCNESELNDSVRVDDQFQHERVNCFHLYKKYIKEIYVRKMQFKDELLASCLEFLLSMPKDLVIHNLNEAFESLEVILILIFFNLFQSTRSWGFAIILS